jgi:hypothetical protein
MRRWGLVTKLAIAMQATTTTTNPVFNRGGRHHPRLPPLHPTRSRDLGQAPNGPVRRGGKPGQPLPLTVQAANDLPTQRAGPSHHFLGRGRRA